MDPSDVRYWRERCEELEETIKQLTEEKENPLKATANTIFKALKIPCLRGLIVAWMYEHYPRTFDKHSEIMDYLKTLLPAITRDTVSLKSLDVLMCRVRQNFEIHGGSKTYIATVYGRGYVLTGEGYAWLQQKIESADHAT